MPNRLLRMTVTQLARGIDRAFATSALKPPRVASSRARLNHDQRLRALGAIASFYARPEFLGTENALFPRPEPIAPSIRPVRDYGQRGVVLDLAWQSAFEPLWSRAAWEAHVQKLTAAERTALQLPESGALDDVLRSLGFDRSAQLREKYLRAQANRTAHARWFHHVDGPRPALVLIHGYMAGHLAIEERVWQVRRLFARGFDVLLTVLPLHGRRRSEARGYLPPAFPSNDTRFTIEGFRQVVFDHRALFDYLLAGRAPRLGVMGMSLGGYSAALLATLEPQLKAAVLFVPLAAIEDLALQSGRMFGGARQQQELRDALKRAQWTVSPFARPSLVPPERVVVVAGEADQVTGLEQARRLAQHFGAELSIFPGGHLLHAGRERAFEPVYRVLDVMYDAH